MSTDGFSPAEIEFLAENELVTIVPTVSMSEIHLSGGTYGPFRPQRPIQVPVWLACTLKKTGHRCHIHAPSWLNETYLSNKVDEEKRSKETFASLPVHYMELALLLLEAASDDIVDSERIRNLLQDLRDIRSSKLINSFQSFQGDIAAIKLNHLGYMELNEIRPFLTRALDELLPLTEAYQPTWGALTSTQDSQVSTTSAS